MFIEIQSRRIATYTETPPTQVILDRINKILFYLVGLLSCKSCPKIQIPILYIYTRLATFISRKFLAFFRDFLIVWLIPHNQHPNFLCALVPFVVKCESMKLVASQTCICPFIIFACREAKDGKTTAQFRRY